LGVTDIDGVAVTNRPGLFGSLLVGLSFAKAFAWARKIPFIAVDHMLAHLYAPRLIPENQTLLTNQQNDVSARAEYPFLGLLVSGGHTIICRADNFDNITVMGTTIDDAVGEAFDKVAKFYNLGYPGGKVIDEMSRNGDARAFNFSMPFIGKGLVKEDHRYDVSYSGLKTAVINQLDLFKVKQGEIKKEDIAASFQRTAVEILLRPLLNAAKDTGLTTIVAGGGVAANSLLRSRLAEQTHLRCIFPPPELCGDNGAMIAGIGYHYLVRGETSPLNINAVSRVTGFKKNTLKSS
jgi:N6-L-threonylcarbamoyladenine synthase